MMGVKKTEAEMKSLLSETIVAWCRDCLSHHAEVSVEGLLGITLNGTDIFLVSINQVIANQTAREGAIPKVLDLSEQSTLETEELEIDRMDPGRMDPGRMDPGKMDPGRMDPGRGESESDEDSLRTEDTDQSSEKAPFKRGRQRRARRREIQRVVTPPVQLTNENSPPSYPEGVLPDHAKGLRSFPTKTTKANVVRNGRSPTKKICPYTKRFRPRVQAYETQSQLVMVKEEGSPGSYQELYHAPHPTPYLQDQVNQPLLPHSSPGTHVHTMPPQIHVNSTNAVAIPGSSDMVVGSFDTQMQSSSSTSSFNTPSHLTSPSSFASSSSGPVFRNLWPERKTNEKTCHFCGREFERPFNLKQHLRVHTGEKPFLCTLCGQSFTRKGNLKAHITHQHAS